MKIIVTGATGLIGLRLVPALRSRGHTVITVTRSQNQKATDQVITWRPDQEDFPAEKLSDVEAVIHLAGENVGVGRWTADKMKKIYDSRVISTRKLVQALNTATVGGPKIFICASGIGYYGDRGDDVLAESEAAGSDFLATVCQDWEGEAVKASAVGTGIRTILIRTGIVLDSHGGALVELLKPFKLGLGAVAGSGRQWMSWIHLDDWVSLLIWALDHESVQGPINAVAPNPVPNETFSKVLSKVLNKPLFLKAPAMVFRLALGKKSRLILDGQRVSCRRIEDAGFHFAYPELEPALRQILLKTNSLEH